MFRWRGDCLVFLQALTAVSCHIVKAGEPRSGELRIAQDGRVGPGLYSRGSPSTSRPVLRQGVRVKPSDGLEPSTLSLPFSSNEERASKAREAAGTKVPETDGVH